MFTTTRCVQMLAILAVVGLASAPAPHFRSAGGPPNVKDKEWYDSADFVKNSQTPFENPRGMGKRTSNVVEAALEVKVATHKILPALKFGDKSYPERAAQLRCYDGKLVGPTLRVRPGDKLKITVKNNIAFEDGTPFSDREPLVPAGANLNVPNQANVTNLHTHGLHVSPLWPADDIFREWKPGEDWTQVFEIPENHPAGTFWYHPHRHGSTAYQLCSGLAGALIVEPGTEPALDEVKEIKEAMEVGREKILVFQQITCSTIGDETLLKVRKHDAYFTPPSPDLIGKIRWGNKNSYLINGLVAPVITMKPGEVQRWRCVHAGIADTMRLCIADADGNKVLPDTLHEIAVDGLPLGELKTQDSILLWPGNRSDFLVKAPPAPGEYLLLSAKVAKNEQSRPSTVGKKIYLARVKVEGTPNPMGLPDPAALKKYRRPTLADLPKDKIAAYRELWFQSDGKDHKIAHKLKGGPDGKFESFDHSKKTLSPRLGTVEQWKLVSKGEQHPFHIHVNPFEVIGMDDEGEPVKKNGKFAAVWRDTILIPEDESVTIRISFERFAGETVLHCHNLDHEDQGMMMVVNILDKNGLPAVPKKQAGLPVLPAPAPVWTLLDPKEKTHRLADFAGQDLVVVFFRGLECSHCRAQLEALAKRQQVLATAKLTVVAISPDTCGDMAQQLPTISPLPFLLLSDPSLDTFRKYGCHDGGALHGTFLIDTQGTVRWQNVAAEPFADVDGLLNAHKKSSKQPRP